MHSNPLIYTNIRQTVYKVSVGYYTGSLRKFIFSIHEKITINWFSKKIAVVMKEDRKYAVHRGELRAISYASINP